MSVGRRAGGVADGGIQAVVRNGDGAGWVAPALAVQQVDQLLAVHVGDGERSYRDGMIILDQDQPARPGWGGRPPSADTEGFDSGVFCF